MTNVCVKCFGAPGLRSRVSEIVRKHDNMFCDFHEAESGAPAEDISEIVDEVFRYHYGPGSTDWNGVQKGDDLDQLIADLCDIDDEQVTVAIVDALIDNDSYGSSDGWDAFYSRDVAYVSVDHPSSNHSRLWEMFCDTVLYDQRFFNERAKRHIEEIFSGIETQKTTTALC